MNLLNLLAEHDHEREAPPHLEARLISEFRARKWRRKAARLGIAGVAASFAVAILLTSRWMPPPGRQIAVAPPALPAGEATGSPAANVQPKLNLPLKPPTRVKIAKKALPQEVVTDFFPLMEAAPPFGRGQIWRVEVPASTMRTVGLPVREEHLADRIQADVLVGEEGMPRAIRFVRFEMR